MLTNSWIITSRATGQAVLETWSATLVARVDTSRYRVETAYAYLVRLNAEIHARGRAVDETGKA